MTAHKSTAALVPSCRDVLVNGAALALATALSGATAAVRGGFSLE